MRKIKSPQIEAFDAVMTCGTTIAAAEVLNSSQPNVSRLINQLEQTTGLELFQRKNGRLLPTKDGLNLHRTVQQYFHGIDQISNAAQQLYRVHQERLTVSCAPALSGGFFARVVARLRKTNPEKQVSMSPLLSRKVIKGLQNNDLDLGIAAYEVVAPYLHSEIFTNCNEVALIPNNHPLASKQIISLSDLHGQPFVKLVDRDPYTKRLFGHFMRKEIVPEVTAEAETSSSACAMVAAGVGIAIINPITALDFTSQEVTMRPLDVSLPFITSLLIPENSLRDIRVQALVTSLKQQYAEDEKEIQNYLGQQQSLTRAS